MSITTEKQTIKSNFLKREITVDIFLPPNYDAKTAYPVVFMNDGQDVGHLCLADILEKFYVEKKQDFVLIAIPTDKNRLKDYGTSFFSDYKKRGANAANYMYFVVNELVPDLRLKYGISIRPEDNAICGFSLGGLSAFDIAWENPHVFSKIGAFSASFWWRNRGYEQGYNDDADRIMHQKIAESSGLKNLKFWLECGTNDETEDRNNNGIIDSIDDTLDIIKELKAKGYPEGTITYVEIAEGQHNYKTWNMIFPTFLAWVLKT